MSFSVDTSRTSLVELTPAAAATSGIPAVAGGFAELLGRAGAEPADRFTTDAAAVASIDAAAAAVESEDRSVESGGGDEEQLRSRHEGSADQALAALGWSPAAPLETPLLAVVTMPAAAVPAGEEAGVAVEAQVRAGGEGGGREGGRRAHGTDGVAGSGDASGSAAPLDGVTPLHGRHHAAPEGAPALPAPLDPLASLESGLLAPLPAFDPTPGAAMTATVATAIESTTGARGVEARLPEGATVTGVDAARPALPVEAAPSDLDTGDDSGGDTGLSAAEWDDRDEDDDGSDEIDEGGEGFREALLSHITDAAVELSGADGGGGEGSTAPDGSDSTAAPAGNDDPALRHGSLGHNRAELVFGDGADRVSLTVAMDGRGVQVHAQLGSTDAAAALLGATEELRRALERHGLSLSGFSANSDGSGGGRRDPSGGGGARNPRGGDSPRTVAVRRLDERIGRGVRVIV